MDEIIEEKSSRWYVDAGFINVPEVILLPFVTSGSNGSNSGSSYTQKEPAFLKKIYISPLSPFPPYPLQIGFESNFLRIWYNYSPNPSVISVEKK